MTKGLASLMVVLAASVAFVVGSSIPGAAQDFYRDKVIRIIVGYRVGGGYDVYTRVLSRHLGKHIPGNPTVVVENMDGAGSLRAANYVYNRADPDGLTLGVFGGGLVTQQALGEKGLRFDARKFHWLGSMAEGTPACVIMGFTGLKTFDDVMSSKKELRFGSTGPGSTTDDLPKLLIGLFTAKINVIRGYGGTSAVRVGMQRKELDGACWTWESIRTTARAMLDDKGEKQLIPFAMEGRYPDPEVKQIPQISARIKDKSDLAAFKAWLNPYVFFRPIVAAPKVTKDKVELLRAGLKKAMEDAEFLAEAKKGKLDVSYTSGEDVAKYVEEVVNTPASAVEKLATMIGRKN